MANIPTDSVPDKIGGSPPARRRGQKSYALDPTAWPGSPGANAWTRSKPADCGHFALHRRHDADAASTELAGQADIFPLGPDTGQDGPAIGTDVSSDVKGETGPRRNSSKNARKFIATPINKPKRAGIECECFHPRHGENQNLPRRIKSPRTLASHATYHPPRALQPAKIFPRRGGRHLHAPTPAA